MTQSCVYLAKDAPNDPSRAAVEPPNGPRRAHKVGVSRYPPAKMSGVTGTQALLAVRREGGFWRDSWRRYKVRVDGVQAGSLGPDEELPLEVPPGIHEVQVKVDWGTSQRLVVQIESGEVRRLRCAPGSLLGIVIPGMYLTLEFDDPTRELGDQPDEGDMWQNVWEDDDRGRS
jgi:hypothetical protein